jgi:hypothetical protein
MVHMFEFFYTTLSSIRLPIFRSIWCTNLTCFPIFWILLPVIHQDHRSVYCVNFVHTRIDVLDSRDYKLGGINSWQGYHGQLGKK